MPNVNPNKFALGVNIDHIAVLREARRINDPDPLMALEICAQNGADQITIHLREDRRHIQDGDVHNIIRSSRVPVNLECAIDENIINIVCKLRPHRATLVPEKREEVTTEGGLDIVAQAMALDITIAQLKNSDIPVSLFIDPDIALIDKAKYLGADMIELHTGRYANLYAMLYSALPYSHHSIKALELPRHTLEKLLDKELQTLQKAANHAKSIGLKVAAGHGLNYQNTPAIAAIATIEELNIGQSIIARSIFTGLAEAVTSMKALCVR
jgi:pyridoxine 5-phosphate synthase